ncbi:hypothetical protein FISHEDRAFT_35804 [Fistulina hepatica ATCC 64428]|uniref:Uncharacterized protein n=1 Tax=Fistulina hepatica ATCC 64428 TaxID=1128425 RepID=A0A0D7AN65_9AGAR|nr:hypothetical protein FISHEDRAFT_35804 [Fistulina hepatica ATCC 64428]
MSLPPAQKDISEKPKAGAVTDPVNKDLKDADVDRKIRLYGVISAFNKGRMPSNAQIDETLRYVEDNTPFPTDKLSQEGQKLVQDARDVIETARTIVHKKNADELFQNFIWHTRNADVDSSKLNANAPVGSEKSKSDGQQAVEHLRTLLSLVLTNSEVRKLLSDFGLIGRDLLSKGASKAAEALAPSPERLAQVDHSGPPDQFKSKDGEVEGLNRTPPLELPVPGTDDTAQPSQISSAAKDGVAQVAQASKGAVQQELEDTSRCQVSDSDDAADAVQEKKNGLVQRMKDFRGNLSDRVPQQHKDTARAHFERGREFLTEEYFPPERRDQFIFRLKKVVVECQKHDDYQSSIKWLLDTIQEYFEKMQHSSSKHAGKVSDITDNRQLQLAWGELRLLLERFANNQSMNPIFDSVEKLSDDAKRDPELRSWLETYARFVRKTVLEAGFILEPACNTEANRLRKEGRRFYDDKYKTHFDDLFNSFANFFKAMGDDPLNVRFGQDWARLTKNLLFNSDGQLQFKTELWHDVRTIILPAVVDRIGYVPIPRIEYTDESLDLVVENLVLSGRNMFPNIVEIEAKNHIKFSPYSAISNTHQHDVTITLSQIQADMRDVAFYFRRKTGIPKISDSGLADVVLGGEGLKVVVHLRSTPSTDTTSVFKVQKVYVHVDSLKFSIRDAKHELLYKTLRPLATMLIKRQLQKVIRGAIETGLDYVDGQLVGVRNRLQEAKETEGARRRDVFADMFKRQEKDTASVNTSTKTSSFKVSTSKRDSLLPEHGHPSGVVNRTLERDELIEKGHEWRSEAYVS